MNSFTVLTYNIWFDNLMLEERTVALISKIRELNPDIVCLQEVRPDIYPVLQANLKRWRFCHPVKINTNYSSVIMSSHPISKCILYPFKNSKMGRQLVIIQVDLKDSQNQTHPIIFATTHFESEFKKKEPNEEKIAQFEVTEKILTDLYEKYRNVVLGVDTNILAHEEGYFFPTKLWDDVYLLLGHQDKKFTYDGRRNVYLMLNKIPFRSRLDRIIFRSESFKLSDYHLIEGDDQEGDKIKRDKDNTEPSDHFGVLARFSFIKKEQSS